MSSASNNIFHRHATLVQTTAFVSSYYFPRIVHALMHCERELFSGEKSLRQRVVTYYNSGYQQFPRLFRFFTVVLVDNLPLALCVHLSVMKKLSYALEPTTAIGLLAIASGTSAIFDTGRITLASLLSQFNYSLTDDIAEIIGPRDFDRSRAFWHQLFVSKAPEQ